MTAPFDRSVRNAISQANEPDCELAADSYMVLQPIFAPSGELLGYEALSRSGWDNQIIAGARTAIQALIEDWVFLELHELARTHQVFVNGTRHGPTDCAQEPLPFDIVLELLEGVQPDQEVLDTCRRFKALGYQTALDGSQLPQPLQRWANPADYARVDTCFSDRTDRNTLPRHLNVKPILLIAEKVKTPEELQIALYEGLSFIHGYYLGSPTPLSKQLANTETNHFSAA